MSKRIEFEMTDDDLAVLMDAGKPVPYMIIGGVEPRSPRENANAAWQRLGQKMGFDHMSVSPVKGKGNKFFTATNKATGE